MKKITFLLLIILTFIYIQAQNDVIALNFSSNFNSQTLENKKLPFEGKNNNIGNDLSNVESASISSERTQESIHAVINDALIKDEYDLSGQFSVSWDADSLYVWTEVKDDILWDGEVNAYENDNIIVFVDLFNQKTESYIDVTQFYWEIYWYEDDPQNHAGRIGPDWGLPPGVIKTVIDEGTSYTLNLSTAWGDIDEGFVPEVGDTLGFDVKISDNDGEGRKQLAWSDITDTGWDNPSVYGEIRLADNGSIDYLTQRPLPPNVTLSESEGDVTIEWTEVVGSDIYRVITPGDEDIYVDNETFTTNYYIETYDNYIFTVQGLNVDSVVLNQSMSILGGDLFELTLMANPEGTGTVEGEGRYAEGEEVIITATPSEGYIFFNWTNEDNEEISNWNTDIFIMPDADITLTANFTDQIPQIAVSPGGFEETFEVGHTSTKELVISNEALGSLNWNIYTQYVVNNKSRNLGDYADKNRKSSSSLPATKSFNNPDKTGKAIGDIIASYENGSNANSGMVWANGFLYLLHYDNGQLLKYDIYTEIIVETYNIHENPYGITWDGEYLWIGDGSGNIRAYNLDGTSAEYSFTTPFSSWSCLAWDNQYFIVAPAFVDNPTFYRLDETGTIIESFESFINMQRFIVYVPRHTEGHIWSNSGNKIIQLSIEGGSVSLIQEFDNPTNDNTPTIAHDGTDIWWNDWDGPIYQVDDGIIEEDWLTYNIESGSVVSGDWQEVEVTFGSENLTAGVYQVVIKVDSNDPQTPHVDIPVIFNIELPYITSITDVNNLTVVYNTIETEVLSQLATTTTIKDQFNNEYTVNLDWSILEYDGSIAGEYTATGVFNLPDGVMQSDPETDLQVVAVVTVLEEGIALPHIVSIEDVVDVELTLGTIEADALAKLSSTTTITDSNNNSYTVNLSWAIAGYDGNIADDYIATGTFELPAGVVQSDPETVLEVSAIVTVLPVYTLTLATDPVGSGTLEGAGDYGEGEIIKVTANANAGWDFISWSDDSGELSTNVAYNYTMPAEDVTLTANFSAIDYKITVNINPDGSGSYSIDPDQDNYHIGDVVTIVASPSSGYEFVSWTYDQEVVSENASYTFTMPANDVILAANFDITDFVSEQEILDIKIFPNPARNQFNVESNEIIKSIKVIGISGLVVKNAIVNDQIAELNIHNITTGVYFVQIYTENGVITKPIVIIR